MTKTTKNERKYGKDIDHRPQTKNRRRNNSREPKTKPVEDMFKILIDGSGFSKAMPYDDCIKVINEMEAKATKLRQPLPSLMLVKQ